MTKLGEAFKDKFEAVRKQLEETPKSQMGVVVPANGVPTPDHTSLKKLAMVAYLGEQLAKETAAEERIRYIPSPLDEGQIVGDFLEWLFFQKKLHPDMKKEYLTALQTRYFMEKDT